MTNFFILYASAAVLVLSAMVTLGVIAIWALNEFRQGEGAEYRAAGFTGSDEQNPQRGPYALARDTAG
jgi:hypothetical protein